MKAYDFEYDNKKLSDYNFMICSFGDKGLETISNGSQITFNTIPILGGSRHELTSAIYEDCLETTIQICKNYCHSDVKEISSTEFRELTKWLSRKKFLKFKPLSEEYIDLYFEATFNISRIEIDGKLIGLELEVKTNRPFALKEPKTIIIENTVESGKLKEVYNWDKYAMITDPIIEYRSSGYVSRGEKDSENEYIIDWTYIEVADEIEIHSDGSFSLVNPRRIDDASYEMISYIIRGRYIYSEYIDRYLRIPYSATVGVSDRGHYIEVYVTEAYELYSRQFQDLKGDFIESVTSEDIRAYPMGGIQDGYCYIYTDMTLVQKEKCIVNDSSHEEGYIYPYTEISIYKDGNLNIYNAIENRNTIIKNCVAGEIITMDYPVIRSSISSHNIQNDFNWNFFRVANTYGNSRNDLTISIPCTIKIKYSPIVKVGL